MTRTAFLLGLLALISLGCQQPSTGESPGPAAAPAAASADETTPATEPAVEYEPAYPSDVSTEDLSESDVAQQKTHSHGDGEEHSHEDGDHGHGEEGHDGHHH